MLFAFIRKILLTLVTLIILSVISYNILLRDPLNDLEGSVIVAYFAYLQDLLNGNLGLSYNSSEPLTTQILNVFPATISLCLAAMCLSLIIGIPLGFLAAVWQDHLFGKLLISLGALSLAVPVFWLAIIWLAYASLNGWSVATVGEIYSSYEIEVITGVKVIDIFLSDSPDKLKMMQNGLQHLVLPTLVLTIPATLEILRITQKRATYVLNQNYVKVAQARGWSLLKVWSGLVLRNTLPALIPMIAHTFTLIFAFGMLIENVVSWSGIGRWLVNALRVQDYNAISAGVVSIGIFVLLVDLIATGLSTLLDPHHKKDWFNVK